MKTATALLATSACFAAFNILACSSQNIAVNGESANGAVKYFTNISAQTGLDKVPAQRAALVDINGDNYLDFVVRRLWQDDTWKNRPSTMVFLNNPDSPGQALQDITKESGLAFESDGSIRESSPLVFADVDNDGDMDAFSGINYDALNPDWKGNRNIKSAVFLNNGKGIFRKLEQSGVEASPATTICGTFLDYDSDGCIDLFVGNWYKQYGASIESYVSPLYQGSGDGKFTDVTEKTGLRTADNPELHNGSKPVYGTGHCDYNNDGFQDILVCAYGRQWNLLWQNKGDGTFAEAGAETHFDGDEITHGRYPPGVNRQTEPPFRANGNSFSVACADYDCDGDMDIFLTEITHSWAGESSDKSSLLTNQGKENNYAFKRDPNALLRKHPDPANWNQGDLHVDWLDFDNDGLQDLLLSSGDYPDGQYLRLFSQKPDHTFEDITDKCGFDWESSAGISIGDFDRDGDLDILAGKSWARMPTEGYKEAWPSPALFRNDIGNRNNWITIQLHGNGKGGANKMGIGARIILEADGKKQIREIYGGNGHAGHFDPPEAHFGLGKAWKIDKITIQWPNKDKTEQTFTNIKSNKLIRIIEGGKIE
ncbi:MAG: CRTAC1 family protein [Planctomycetes bacterium]|nr:CRTAC1 family protein [Planctomycetota bacterium]